MYMKMKAKLLSCILCCMLIVGMLPVSAFASTRTVVSEVEMTTATGDITPAYGDYMELPEFTVTVGQPAKIAPSMCNWYKLNSDGITWDRLYYGMRFTEGTYRYGIQIRIDGADGSTHKFDNDGVTVEVDGVEWNVLGDIQVFTNYSYVTLASPEYEVELGAGQEPLEEITSLNANITAPVPGQKPSLEAVTESDDYEARVVAWQELDTYEGTPTDIDDPENYTFVEGKIYHAIVQFECTDENAFFSPSISNVRINGMLPMYAGRGYYRVVFMDVPEDEIVTFEVKTGVYMMSLTDGEEAIIDVLEYNEQLIYDPVYKGFRDAEGKALFRINDYGVVVLEEGVGEEDNITYILNPDERETVIDNFGVEMTEARMVFVESEPGVLSIKIETGKHTSEFNMLETRGLNALIYYDLIEIGDNEACYNSEGKLLFTVDDEEYIEVAEGANQDDNIIYELNNADVEELYDEFGIIFSEIRLIVGEEPTYKVSFVANGGTGTMADVTDVSGEYTLPANGFTAPTGKQFKAWSVDGVEKAAGDKITVTADTIVTAVWENIPHICTLTPVAKVDPTCTEKGKEAYYTCSGCGKYYEDALGEEEIPDLIIWGNIDTIDHIDGDGDGTCDKCRGSVSGNGTGGGSTSGPDELPGDVDAGDSNMAWMWIAMLLISGAGVAAVVALRKKLYFEK